MTIVNVIVILVYIVVVKDELLIMTDYHDITRTIIYSCSLFILVKDYKPVRIIPDVLRPRGLAVFDNGDIVVAESEWSSNCVTIIPSEEKDQSPLPGTIKRRRIEQLSLPCGVVITKDDHLLVTENHRLQKLTTDGVCLKSVGSASGGSGELEFRYPEGITVHPTTGQIFVAEFGNNRIQVLNEDLTFSHMITLHGDKQLDRPIDVSLDNDGYLYIAEWGNHCITKVTTTGEYITRIGSGGTAPGQLRTPTSIAINNSTLYVTEYDNRRVSVFDTKGHFLQSFGGKEFNIPDGIAIDKLGNLYISDYENDRIVVFEV